MQTISIRLIDANNPTFNFSGYKIIISYYDHSHFQEVIRDEFTDMDGSLSTDLPDKKDLLSPVKIDVKSPDGEILRTEWIEISDINDNVKKIELEPKVFPNTIQSDDPYLGKHVRLTGNVITEDGKGISNRSLAIWAQELNDESEFKIILTSSTDKTGYFFGDYPHGSYKEAYGIVDVGKREKIPIRLIQNRIPLKIPLVITEFLDLDKLNQSTSIDNVPRNPDLNDLVNSSDTFFSDIGGKCIDFTSPNRTLEEFSYYAIVRTTEPTIKGLTLFEPRKIAEDMKKLLAPLLNSPTKSNSSATEGDEAGTTPEVMEKRQAEKIKNIMTSVSPNVLRQIVRDPDNFTPPNLMRAATRSQVSTIISQINNYTKSVSGRALLSSDNAVDWDDEPTFYQATSIAHGHILHFKQKWTADGYSLGNLLYSVPLGPCQKKQIAIIDWERKEAAIRTESLEEQENLNALLSRDRAISDIVNASLTEGIHAKSESSTWGASGGFGLDLGMFSIGGGGGGSGSDSQAWQDSARLVSASALNMMRDSIMQSASAFRSQKSTVVQTVQQGETVRATTDVLTNNNHCHAITVEYFEVLRHLLVSQEIADVQECLFIPLLMSRFDIDKVVRWESVLRKSLRDRSLQLGFDAVDRIVNDYEGSNFPLSRYSQERILDLRGELRIYMYVSRPKDLWFVNKYIYDPRSWAPIVDAGLLDGFTSSFGHADLGDRIWHEQLNDERTHNSQGEKEQIFQTVIAPYIVNNFVKKFQFLARDDQGVERRINLDPTLQSSYTPLGGELVVTLRSQGGLVNLSREQIMEFVIRISSIMVGASGGIFTSQATLPAGSRIVIQTGSLRYRTEHMNHALFTDSGILDDLSNTNETSIVTPPDTEETRDPRGEDSELSRKLLAHLNEDIEFYHKAIWINMDRDRRFMLLDGFLVPGGNGRSVASVVENRLIGIIGNSMVVPVAPGYHLDPTFNLNKDGTKDLLNQYATKVPPISITIPTRGVYAESVMGKCNSCETKDDSKYWKFEESPCGVEPTPIAPISTETRRAETGDLRPQQLPTPLVNLQNVPSAPEPSGLDNVLKLMGLSSLFPNLTGLDQTQKNALGALTSSADLAKTFLKETAISARQQRMLKEGGIEKALQKIDETEKSNGISSDQARELRVEALRSMTGLASKNEASVLKKPEITKILDHAKEFGTLETSLSSPGEFASIKTTSLGSSRDLANGEICGYFGLNVKVSEKDLIDAICTNARLELQNWRDENGLIQESQESHFGFLVGYWLSVARGAGESSVMPTTLRVLQSSALDDSIDYGDLLEPEATDSQITDQINSLIPVLVAGAPDKERPPNLNRFIETALRNARFSFIDDEERGPWSAAFISSIVRGSAIQFGLETLEGENHVGFDKLLRCSTAHSAYVFEAWRRRFSFPTLGTYQAFEVNKRIPREGDIIIQDRQNSVMRFDQIRTLLAPGQGHKLHGDVIIEVSKDSGYVETIGGNLDNSVRRRRYPLNSKGMLVVKSSQLYVQENDNGEIPTLRGATSADPLNDHSTGRIFAILGLVQECTSSESGAIVT